MTTRSATFSALARRGFTAIELLVVMAMVAILMGLAGPALQDLVQANRTTTEMARLLQDLQYARSEAARQGMPVSVCISSDGTGCATSSTDWRAGWIIFADPDGDQVVDATDTVLRRQTAFDSTDTLSDSSTAAFTYNREGFAQSLNGAVMLTVRSADANTRATRCLVANRLGQLQVLAVAKAAYGKTCAA